MMRDELLGPFAGLLAQISLALQSSPRPALDWSILRHLRRTARDAYQQGRAHTPLETPSDLACACAWHCLDSWYLAAEDPTELSQQLKWISLAHWISIEQTLKLHLEGAARC